MLKKCLNRSSYRSIYPILSYAGYAILSSNCNNDGDGGGGGDDNNKIELKPAINIKSSLKYGLLLNNFKN